MRVVFTDRALGDLNALRIYITADNPTAAQAQVYTILSQVALLATQPLLGRSGRIVGTRELVITGTRYVVAYLVDSDVSSLYHGHVITSKEMYSLQQISTPP
ncbi:MAG: type II toxin-antitoxin system RelE/ParE family toxin [Acidobacteria bacterium]|nr:type II toxin-antitoxin system RelE/ParE family toxin [Acidobacteriota bacterium]